jgi:hypothetical protein
VFTAALVSSAFYSILSEGKAQKYGRFFALLMLIISAHFALLTS